MGLECEHGELYLKSGDPSAGAWELTLKYGTKRSVNYWVDANGKPLSNTLGVTFNVRNVISRKEKIEAEFTEDMLHKYVDGNCPELESLLDDLFTNGEDK